MNYERFHKIIKKNKKIEYEVNEVLQEFYEKVNIEYDSIKIIKEVGEIFGVTVFEIPMIENDFGAVSYKTDYGNYIFLNTNQSRCKMNFSYYHDIYHILRDSSNMLDEIRLVHFNDDYIYDDNECKANLFSANILMPKKKFTLMYNHYYEKSNKDFKITVYKLMNYFSAPYISVLLRICELELIDSMEYMANHLNYSENDLIEEFNELGISNDILKPTLADDSIYLYKTLENSANKLINKGLLDNNRYERLMTNIRKLVDGIKIDGSRI